MLLSPREGQRHREAGYGAGFRESEKSEVLAAPPGTGQEAPHWTAGHGKPIIFVILTMVAVGVYVALGIPVAVFPNTDFPRIVVGGRRGCLSN